MFWKNTFKYGSLFAVIVLLLSAPSTAQTSKKDQRALRERGTDSAWLYNPFWGQPRFYLGTTRVSVSEFENTLRNSDAEVDALIGGATRKLNTARFMSLGAAATTMAGALLISNQTNYSSSRNNRLNPTGLVLMSAGLLLEGVALGFGIDGSNRVRNGLRLFNQKAKNGQLRPAQASLGPTNHGVGFAINF
ncbi:MAG: hypothetical protein EAY75_13515 [Bacteroidetes bacterium]|nr:MAG: hypothetical protein EAY75_13515 [Bacteroidota bacterium]